LSAGAKLRVFREPWVKTPPPADGNESVHAFLARRFGVGIADAFADSIVSGVFAGDAKALTMRGAFPRATDAEAAAGSVIKGMKSGGKPGKLISFRGGMQTLVDRMAGDLGSSIRFNSEVTAIEPHENGVTVRVNGESIEASDVLLATPPGKTAALIAPIDQESARDLRTIRSARVAVIVTGFREEQVRTPVDGFGFLVPRREKMRILGSLWTSSIYPGSAPEGRVLFRTMMGGMHDPKALTLPGRALLPIALRELNDVMGIDGDPEFIKVYKHDPGIPQYEAGHEEIVKRVASRIGPRVSMIGNGVDGVSVAKLLELYERGLSFQPQAGTRAGVAG
ncbi:MAG: protoporphyrinogen oxidase, partial [Gemmatimonadetes bacterium]|nr:protoporphyrinogen oxidase [Gemmatimonadota bacterium]